MHAEHHFIVLQMKLHSSSSFNILPLVTSIVSQLAAWASVVHSGKASPLAMISRLLVSIQPWINLFRAVEFLNVIVVGCLKGQFLYYASHSRLKTNNLCNYVCPTDAHAVYPSYRNGSVPAYHYVCEVSLSYSPATQSISSSSEGESTRCGRGMNLLKRSLYS